MSLAPGTGTRPIGPGPAKVGLQPAVGAPSEKFSWPLVLLVFVLMAAGLIAKAMFNTGKVPLLNDTDDAMRMVTVRDLLAGQNWLDHTQYRLNTPFGVDIPWSHLVDAAIGGIIMLLRPVFGSMAETVAVYVWPLLLLLALLTLCARIAFRLAGRQAMLPALVLPILSPALISEFSPGRIDHHSIQILSTLLMAWASIEAIERPRFAIVAGLAAAGSLAIGIEGLPSIVSAIIAIAMIWVAHPDRRSVLLGFGVSFALATLAVFAQALPPDRWFAPACDEISIVYASLAVGTGIAFALLALLPLGRSPWLRLVVGGVAGAVLVGGLAILFPACLKGPYAALDPWLVTNWLDRITEAQPLWETAKAFDPFAVAVALPPFLGLAVIAWRVLAGDKAGRGEWLILGVFLAIAIAIMLAQIRGARLAAPLALPAAGWFILTARRRYLGGATIAGALGMLAGWIGFAGLIIAVIVVLASGPFQHKAEAAVTGLASPSAGPGASEASCLLPDAFTALAKLPPARVMNPIDLGSHILLFTPHAVVAAPYHRDQRGVLDTFNFFNGPIADARAILAARSVNLVVICPAMAEMQGLADAAPDSFVKLYAKGEVPPWLKALSAKGDALKLYAVLP
jgi:hypothetical protein